MTKLRVLSGKHTGAFIDLFQPLLKVGPSEDYDIYIGDWNAQTINLVKTPEGHCEACWPQGDGELAVLGARVEGGNQRCAMWPWIPVRFGAIILCIGPADAPWPDDADLLQRLFAPPPPVVSTELPGRRGLSLMFVGIALIAVVSSAAVIAVNRRQERPLVIDAAKDPAQAVREALADKPWRDLEVLEERDRLVVRGVLESTPDVTGAHRRLDSLRLAKPVVRHFLDAAAVVNLVQESTPGAGLTVTRTGARTFNVAGRSTEIVHTQRSLLRLRIDLSQFGVDLVSSVEAHEEGSSRISGTLIDKDGASYARTRDGVRHIVSPNHSAAASATRQALSQ